MSGKLHPPLLTPTQAQALLDQVIYDQVLECIDLDALHRLEQSLTMMVGELDGASGERTGDMASDMVTAMLDRALRRIPADVRSYLQAASWPPFGGCELCEREDDGSRPTNQPPARQPPTRLKS